MMSAPRVGTVSLYSSSSVKSFEAGDHIERNCGYYNHHAIFVGPTGDGTERARIIHRVKPTPPAHHNNNNNALAVSSVCAPQAGSIAVVTLQWKDLQELYTLVARPADPTCTLQRALNALLDQQERLDSKHRSDDDDDYHVVFQNCEHFCTWCIHGSVGRSDQVLRHGYRLVGQVRQWFLERGGGGLTRSRYPGLCIVTGLAVESAQHIQSWLEGCTTGAACRRSLAMAAGGAAGAALGAQLGRAALCRVVVAGSASSGTAATAAVGLSSSMIVGAAATAAILGAEVVGGAMGHHWGYNMTRSLVDSLFERNVEDAIVVAYNYLAVSPNATMEEKQRAFQQRQREVRFALEAEESVAENEGGGGAQGDSRNQETAGLKKDDADGSRAEEKQKNQNPEEERQDLLYLKYCGEVVNWHHYRQEQQKGVDRNEEEEEAEEKKGKHLAVPVDAMSVFSELTHEDGDFQIQDETLDCAHDRQRKKSATAATKTATETESHGTERACVSFEATSQKLDSPPPLSSRASQVVAMGLGGDDADNDVCEEQPQPQAGNKVWSWS